MLNWNSSLLFGVIIVFLIIFFWDFLIGKNICKERLVPLYNLERTDITNALVGKV